MSTTKTKKLDLRFHSQNGVFHREYEIKDDQEIKHFVDGFFKLIEREDLFDLDQATQSLIDSGEYQDGALILSVKVN